MKILLPFVLIVLFFPLSAQVEEVSVGQGYSNSTFFRVGDASSTTVDPTSWDIAFSLKVESAGVFVNEAAGSSMGTTLPEVELYVPVDSDYDNLDTAGMIRIYNPEVTWTEGAFNSIRDLQNPYDYGWGVYDEMNDEIIGTEVFVVQLRNGSFKKIQIQSLVGSVFSFRYADLDGSNEMLQSLVQTDYSGTLVYFSLESGTTVDIEPTVWDLKFCRYTDGIDNGSGELIQYLVTGVLVNEGVEVALADSIDPFNVDPVDYENDYVDTISAIGHDWKYFDLANFMWVIDLDRVYFVKTTENELWRLFFLSFDGSTTGNMTFERSLISGVTSLEDTYQNLQFLEVFPNPASDYFNIALEVASAVKGNLRIFDAMGQSVIQVPVSFDAGLNVQEISLDLPAGNYAVQLQVGNELITRQLVILK